MKSAQFLEIIMEFCRCIFSGKIIAYDTLYLFENLKIMKSTKFFIFGTFLFLISGSVLSQSVTYSSAESLFNDEQIRILEKAEKFIDRAESNISEAEQIESKYEKFKSKKKAKFDKKTVE